MLCHNKAVIEDIILPIEIGSNKFTDLLLLSLLNGWKSSVSVDKCKSV